jgi:LysM repeat protein
MPSPATLLGGSVVILFAFLLGRCTAGGDHKVATDSANTTVATLLTTTTGFDIIHIVKENESLAAIASQYGVTIEQIAIANNIGNTNNIIVGQRLRIPPPTPITTTTTTLAKKKGK